MRSPDRDRGTFWVALVLAIGIATAVNIIVIAVLYDAIASEGPGLSENATQILTTAFSGIIGVLGGFLGYRAGRAHQREVSESTSAAPEAPDEDPSAPV